MEVSFGKLNEWSNNVETVAKNIKAKVKALRREGIVGMTRNNLKMVTPTTGVTIGGGPNAYERLFDQALERCCVRGFIIRG